MTVNNALSSSSSHMASQLQSCNEWKIDQVRDELLPPLIVSKTQTQSDLKGAHLAMSSDTQPFMALQRVKRQRGAVEVSPGEEFLAQSGASYNLIGARPTSDSEGALYSKFEMAFERGSRGQQVVALRKLARCRLGKGDYHRAAHLFSGALAVARKSNPTSELVRSTYFDLMEVEHFFLREKLGVCGSRAIHPIHYINQLERVRKEARAEMNNANGHIAQIQAELTRGFEVVLRNLLSESISLLQEKVPCEYAVMGLGSMARGEMAPYSDIEFAFLIRNRSPESLAYFRRLSELLSLKVLMLGETKYDLVRPRRIGSEMCPPQSLVPGGFSMDIGGLCPSGKPGIYELIGTPTELAAFQDPSWLQQRESEIILVNAMATVSWVAGKRSLVEQYERLVVKKVISGSSSRKQRAIELMRGSIHEFRPRLNQDKTDLRGFDVKCELYRLPQMIIRGLALYYGLQSKSTLGRIDELRKKEVLSVEGANRLRRVVQKILYLRMKTHLFYKGEREVLYHSRGPLDPLAKTVYLITPSLEEEIEEIYRSLCPLHLAATFFVEGDHRAFAHSPLYDWRVGRSSDHLRTTHRFDEALQFTEARAALHPNNPHARFALALVNLDLGQAKLAIENYAASIERLGEESKERPKALANLAQAYGMVGSLPDAVRHASLALSLWQKRGSSDDVAQMRYLIGSFYRRMGDWKASRGHFRLGLASKGLTDSQIRAQLQMGFGDVALELGRYEKAIARYHSVLSLLNRDDLHSEACCLGQLASAYRAHGEIAASILFFGSSLMVWTKIYGNRPHPEVARTLGNLGNSYQVAGRFDDANECYGRALLIWKSIDLGPVHPNLANVLMNRATLHRAMGDPSRAILEYLEALEIWKHWYESESHPEPARVWGGLGNGLQEEWRLDEAMECYRVALSMWSELYQSRPCIERGRVLHNLAMAHHKKGHLRQAISLYHSSLDMKQRVFLGAEPPDAGVTLFYLGCASARLGSLQVAELEAIARYDEALRSWRPLAQKGGGDLAICLLNLGDQYRSLNRSNRAIDAYALSLKSEKGPTLTGATATRRMGLEALRLKQGGRAQGAFEMSQFILKRIRAQSGVKVAHAFGNLANATPSAEQAIECYSSCLSLLREASGDHQREIRGTIRQLATVLYHSQRYKEARDCLAQLLQMQKNGSAEYVVTSGALRDLDKQLSS